MWSLYHNLDAFCDNTLNWLSLSPGTGDLVVLLSPNEYSLNAGTTGTYATIYDPASVRCAVPLPEGPIPVSRRYFQPSLAYRVVLVSLMTCRWLLIVLRYILQGTRVWDYCASFKEAIGTAFGVVCCTALYEAVLSVDLRGEGGRCVEWAAKDFVTGGWHLYYYHSQTLTWYVNTGGAGFLCLVLLGLRSPWFKNDSRLGQLVPDSKNPIYIASALFFTLSAGISVAIIVLTGLVKLWNVATLATVCVVFAESQLQVSLGLHRCRPTIQKIHQIEAIRSTMVNNQETSASASENLARRQVLNPSLLSHLEVAFDSDKRSWRRAAADYLKSRSPDTATFWHEAGNRIFADDPRHVEACHELNEACIETGPCDDYVCTICLSKQPDVLFRPCGHVLACTECVHALVVSTRQKTERERHQWYVAGRR